MFVAPSINAMWRNPFTSRRLKLKSLLNCKLTKFAVNLAKNPMLHGRSKHIKERFNFLREQVHNGRIEMVHHATESELADGLP